MNPYFGLGMTVKSLVEGLTREYEAGDPLNQDLYLMSEDELARSGAQRLPRNLMEAVEILKADELAADFLGESMLDSYLKYKIDEWERYHQTTTDWELQEYLRLY